MPNIVLTNGHIKTNKWSSQRAYSLEQQEPKMETNP